VGDEFVVQRKTHARLICEWSRRQRQFRRNTPGHVVSHHVNVMPYNAQRLLCSAYRSLLSQRSLPSLSGFA
jgi:hypothetical protein